MFILTGLVILSCEDYKVGQQPIDSTAPGPVSNVQVVNVPGGAVLSYTLPSDEDLLYVKAVYELHGATSEVRSSLYNDTLRIAGYGDTLEHKVTLYAVDRSKNESSPVEATFQPEESPVAMIGKSFDLYADFGGVTATWENVDNDEVSVHIVSPDSIGDLVSVADFYTTQTHGEGSVRGLDTIPMTFGIYALDRWGNSSDTLFEDLLPLFETSFDKSLWSEIDLPNDITTLAGAVGGWSLRNMWDGYYGWNTGDNGFSSPGGSPYWPQSVTIDLGVLGKLSRIVLFQRGRYYLWIEGNPKHWELWGSPVLDNTGDWENWTLLRDCISVKPSGLPFGQTNDEDVEVAMVTGENFNIPTDAPAVRYIRIRVLETWQGGTNFQIGEIFVYGDNRSEKYQ